MNVMMLSRSVRTRNVLRFCRPYSSSSEATVNGGRYDGNLTDSTTATALRLNLQGKLADKDENDDNALVKNGEPEYYKLSLKKQRLHPHNALGKTTGGELLVLPSKISEYISELTLNQHPQDLRQKVARYYVDLGRTAVHRPAVDKADTDSHLLGVFLQSYASTYSVLKEAQRRMGEEEWRPKKILDVGFGPATGIVALNEVMKDVPDWNPDRKNSVIIGNGAMKKRAKGILKAQEEPEEGEEGSTNISHRLPGYNSTKKYDLIIATHQLYRSDFHFPASVDDHTAHLLSLLEPDGILVLVERGDPKGFESIARARQIMLRPEDHATGDISKTPRVWKGGRKVSSAEDQKLEAPYKVKVLAPCSHHGTCPLSVGLDKRVRSKNSGFYNWCKFGQMVQRPKYMIELKKGQYLASKWDEETPGRGPGGKALAGSGRPGGKSFETASHSYLIVQRSDNKPIETFSSSDSWARVLRPPMKRDKHVIMEVCSPTAEIEQWTVTKGFNKQAYHDARKATGGDLWALSAKSFQARGGNRKALAKAERAVERSKGKFPPEEAGEQQSNEILEQQQEDNIIKDAWEANDLQLEYNQEFEDDDENFELETYFNEMEDEFVKSQKYQRQIAKERKAQHWEKKSKKKTSSRW